MMKKMTKEMADIVEHIVDYFKSLPDGTEISTSEAVEHLYNQKMYEGECIIDGYELSFDDFFKIDYAVYKKALKLKLIVDQPECNYVPPTGLPFYFRHVITHKEK